ncbi:AraC family transcriptional regulator [Streptomyces sp. NBC_00663]|uniref:AraC family transcriptional regulator n=1 Tax=Streptomyces sp. NBC_00663 TaxID=2975801 RepID=UPI002E311A95|nr:AraC family transcriptional regulator [Streptomyces sp. NBC_00663]
MDVLSDAIAAMRTGRPHSGRRDKYAPWGMRIEDSEGAGFHVVLRGSAWLLPSAGEPVALAPGDVVFLAHGRGYALTSGPDVEPTIVRFQPDAPPSPPPPPVRDAAPDTVLLCGAYWLDRSRAHPLLTELPEVVHLPATVGAHRSLRATVELLGSELEEPRPGSDAIVAALLDTLLLYILRAWWQGEARTDRHPTGWAAALADPAVTAALQAVHAAPDHPWTVEELGAHGGLSRAAFARRFTTLVGRPPLAYLTWWRMTTAGRLLREADLPLRQVAQRTGYTSEFAFAKAFKREYGVAPGQYRRHAS